MSELGFSLAWSRGPYQIVDTDWAGIAGAWAKASEALDRVRGARAAARGGGSRSLLDRQEAQATEKFLRIGSQLEVLAGLEKELPRREIPPYEGLPPGWTRVPPRRSGGGSRFEDGPCFGGESEREASLAVLLLPPDGVFLPTGPAGTYAPLDQMDAILRDVEGIRPDDRATLLRFVNTWGRLGVGIPGAPGFSVDGVGLVAESLRRLRAWRQAIYQIRTGRASDVNREELERQLLTELQGPLGLSVAELLRGDGRLRLRTLWEALVLQLWRELTGKVRLRRCRNDRCGRLFSPGRSDQAFCSGPCARRFSARRHWQRTRRHMKNPRTRKGGVR